MKTYSRIVTLTPYRYSNVHFGWLLPGMKADPDVGITSHAYWSTQLFHTDWQCSFD